MEILIVVLIILVIYLVIKLLIYKSQLRSFVKQLKFIEEHDTNLEIISQISSKEIVDLTGEINVLIRKHKHYKANMEHSNFIFKQTITNVSHDLRTPLTSISGYLKMLQNKNLDEKKRAEYTDVVSKRIESTKKLISQLFEYTRIETGEFQVSKSRVNFSELIKQKLLSYYESFEEKNFNVSLNIGSADIFINADDEALERVIENLIINALIHGEGEFIVELFRKNNKAYLLLQNKSYDIDFDEIDSIFERFYTTDKSRSKRTTGLGLSITKRLVELMDGRISAYYDNGNFGIEIEFPVYKKINENKGEIS